MSVKPKLLELHKQVELVPNVSYVLNCIALSGKNLVFSWTKDGRPLTGSATVKVDNSESASFLTFTKLQPHHSGTYVCNARVGESRVQEYSTSTSTRLLVKGSVHSYGYRLNVSVLFDDKRFGS